MRTPLPALALCLLPAAAVADKTAPEPPRLRHQAAVSALAFAPDGKTLAAASDDGAVILWRVADGTEVRRFEGHRGRVSALAFAPDGKTLVSGSEEGPLFVWDAASGKRLRVLEGHDEWVLGLAFSPDGKTLASCAYDRTVRLWDAATGKALRVLKGHAESVSAVAFSPDGRRLASVDYQSELFVWDVASGKETLRLRHRKRRVEMNGVAFARAGRTVVTATAANGVAHWDATTGELQPRAGAAGMVTKMAGSADGKTLLVGEVNGLVTLLDADTGARLVEFEAYRGVSGPAPKGGASSTIRSVALTPAADLAAAGAKDGRVYVWKVADLLLPGRTLDEKLKPAELNELWADLAEEGDTAAKAVAVLAARPSQAVPLLKERLRVPEVPDRKEVTRLVEQLDDDSFDKREEASRALAKTLPGSAAILRKALESAASVEVRVRLAALLAPLDDAGEPDRLRQRRAVQALERMATPEARALLEALAHGPARDLADDAAAALRRLR